MNVIQSETDEHKQLVASLIEVLKSKKELNIISAAYPGYSEPEKVGRHEPDIIARDSSLKIHVGEAKTAKDLDSARSAEQFLDFVKKSDVLHIIIPKLAVSKLREKLHFLGVGSLEGDKIIIWS